MSGLRRWQVIAWQYAKGSPFYSLGIHLDLHTPTLDVHLPFWTLQFGRNLYWTRANRLPGMHFPFGDRILIGFSTDRWDGHSDNCDHERRR